MQDDTTQRELASDEVSLPDDYRRAVFEHAMHDAGLADYELHMAMGEARIDRMTAARNAMVDARCAREWLLYVAVRREKRHVGGPLKWPAVEQS